MKIVAYDNLNRENVSEFVVVENIKDGYEDMLLQPLEKLEEHSNWCYKLVDDSYVCYEGNSVY